MRNSKRQISKPQISRRQAWYRAIVLLSLLPLAGCIATKPNNNGQQTQVQVAVSPTSPPPIGIGVSTPTTPSTQQFTATVTGLSNTAVTWSLGLAPNQVSSCTNSGNGPNGLGSFVTNGNNSMTYSAPQNLTASPCGVAITATASDNVTTGQTLASVHVVVTISPLTDNIGQGANLQYTASVAGAPMTTAGQAIGWNATGGGAFDNSAVNDVLANPGLYIAPPLGQGNVPITVNVTATSGFDANQFAQGTLTVVANDPLGTASPTTAAAAQLQECPTFTDGVTGATAATCYQVNTTCDGVLPYSVYLKVNTPPAGTTLLGTVIFTTGSGGSTLYDNDPNFLEANGSNGGKSVVQGILNEGYTTVQVSFGSPFNDTNTENGWLQGPGGVRRLACRYATVADWISKNQQGLNTHASSTTPLCATGNSGGSGAIGYAVTEYGLASEFAMIEPTSGPVMTRIDQGCNVCGPPFTGYNPCDQTQTNMCYSVSSGGTGGGATASIIDTAYQAQGQSTPTLCTNGVGGDNSQGNRFLSDSILDDPQKTQQLPIPDPPTFVRVLFGGMDNTNAVPEGETWWSGVFPEPQIKPYCVADAPHAIPSVADGAQQIINDIQNYCRAQ